MAFSYTPTSTAGAAVAAYCSGLTVDSGPIARKAVTGGTADTAETVTIAASATNLIEYGYEIDPTATTVWAGGTWTINLNVTTAAATGTTWSEVYICRLNSSNVNQATIGSNTSVGVSVTSTGNKSTTVTGSAQTPNPGDKVYIVLAFTNSKTSTHTLGVTPAGNDIVSPFIEGEFNPSYIVTRSSFNPLNDPFVDIAQFGIGEIIPKAIFRGLQWNVSLEVAPMIGEQDYIHYNILRSSTPKLNTLKGYGLNRNVPADPYIPPTSTEPHPETYILKSIGRGTFTPVTSTLAIMGGLGGETVVSIDQPPDYINYSILRLSAIPKLNTTKNYFWLSPEINDVPPIVQVDQPPDFINYSILRLSSLPKLSVKQSYAQLHNSALDTYSPEQDTGDYTDSYLIKQIRLLKGLTKNWKVNQANEPQDACT